MDVDEYRCGPTPVATLTPAPSSEWMELLLHLPQEESFKSPWGMELNKGHNIMQQKYERHVPGIRLDNLSVLNHPIKLLLFIFVIAKKKKGMESLNRFNWNFLVDIRFW